METQTKKAVLFTNWTGKDFSWTWDGTEYSFPAGQSTMLPDWQAAFFAKHLADQYLNDKELPTNHFSRKNVIAKCFDISRTVEAKDATQLQSAIMNETEPKAKFCDFCDSKGVRHKKDCTRNEIEESNEPDDEEFEGLKQ